MHSVCGCECLGRSSLRVAIVGPLDGVTIGWMEELLDGARHAGGVRWAQAFSSTPMAACTTGSGGTTSTTVEVRLWRCGVERRGEEGMVGGLLVHESQGLLDGVAAGWDIWFREGILECAWF